MTWHCETCGRADDSVDATALFAPDICLDCANAPSIFEQRDRLAARVRELEAALREVIDCEDFSVKRAFTMKMIARAALEPVEQPVTAGDRKAAATPRPTTPAAGGAEGDTE